MKLNPLAWFRRASPRIETKASATGPAIAAFTVGRPVWSERNYEAFAKEGYSVNAILHRCVKLIAQNAASPPWLLYGKGDQEIEEHPLLDLLRKPNPTNGGAALFEAFYAYLAIAGNTYLEFVSSAGKQKAELWSLRPDRMQIIPGPYGMPQAYRYEVNGRQVDWQVDPRTGMSPVLHVKEFHPINDWYGLSPVEPAAYGVDRYNAASAHNKALLDNGARPSGALIFEPVKGAADEPAKAAPEEVIAAAKEEMEERHGGPKNAGRPFVFGGNVKWEEMGVNAKDGDFVALSEAAARDICTAMGVPHVLIVPGEATYNNIRDMKLDLWESRILPLIDKTLDALNTWLVPQFGDGMRLTIDYDDVQALEPRRESKRQSTVELFDKGLLTRDEAREALQYDPWPDGQVGKVDAPVLSAVIGAIQQVGVEPAERYLQSTGLYPQGQTVAGAVAALPDELTGPSAEEIAAAMTPQAGGSEDRGAEGGLYNEFGEPLAKGLCEIEYKKKPRRPTGDHGGPDAPSK